MVSRGHVPLYAVIACDVTVHDRGRAVPVAVVHGRRACGRGVVAVITAALGVRRAWPSCRGFCVAVVWLRHADGC